MAPLESDRGDASWALGIPSARNVCRNCGNHYTRGEASLWDTTSQTLRAIPFTLTNLAMSSGRLIFGRKAYQLDLCPQCKGWQASCPNCRAPQYFAYTQSGTQLTCDECRAKYWVL